MSSSYDKLERILRLESDQKYLDRAVIGGLQRFLIYWQKEARKETPDVLRPVPVDEVVLLLSDYGDLVPAAREQVIAELVSRMAAAAEQDEPVSKPEANDSAEVDAAQPTRSELIAEARVLADDRADGAKIEHRSEPRPAVSRKPNPSASLSDPVTVLRGISTVNQERLARLGIHVLKDLMYHFPHRYDDFGQLKTISRLQLGDEVTVVGAIRSVDSRRSRNGQPIVTVVVSDGTGKLEAAWFHQPYLKRRFHIGNEIVLSGKIDEYLGRLTMVSPEWEPLQRELLHTRRLVPVYPLTEGVGARWMRRTIKNVLDDWVPRIADPLPSGLIQSEGLMSLGEALAQIHFPNDQVSLQRARQRLCFDEFLLIQLGVLHQRQAVRAQTALALDVPRELVTAFVEGLPFELTGAQMRAIGQILDDIAQPVPMSRLLQGDVGSGKTVVAVAAIVAAVKAGAQAALMAPTSILAEQHYRSISGMLESSGLRIALLTGSLSQGEKDTIVEQSSAGELDLVIGTHALIQERVAFEKLGLVIVDEQHRFGVRQRGALRAKGSDLQPHMLAMSATPIPRTLAMTLYGDLDVTVLDEMPPNRQQVITAVRDDAARERIYSFVRSQVNEGRQAFVICPLVEESDTTDAKAAEAEYERLQKAIFPRLKVALVHGRMSAAEKARVMSEFGAGRYDILVSTAVVEVGVDIPNASVMLIEGAERFGLAQLHQFRGRVGRGEFKSYCILLSSSRSEEAVERLRAMEQISDGFQLAEQDLKARGPGQFFGVRQHGLPELKVANLGDVDILSQARASAMQIISRDPDLGQPEHQSLAASVRHFWANQELV